MPLLSIALLSAAAIGHEILLMRFFSIIQWHHFAYMIISLALLGYGASGTLLGLAGGWLRERFAAAFIAGAVLMSVSMLGGFAVAQQIPFNALEILWTPRQWLYLSGIYFLMSVPFFCAATAIGLALAAHPDRIHRIYRSDLLGAGAGAAVIVFMLSTLSLSTCLKGLAGFPLIAAAWIARDERRPSAKRTFGLLLFAGAVVLILWPGRWAAPHPSEFKGLSQALKILNARVIHESSGPLGRLTVVESPTIPFRYVPGMSLSGAAEPPAQLGVFTDGDALSVITRFDGRRASLAYLDQTPAALPYHLLKRPRVLILGVGGGADVLPALYHDAAWIDAVELNPQMVNLVKERYAEFAGHLYSRSNVRVHVAEARGFAAGSRERYDLIQLSLLDSFSAASAGVHGLSESYLYTTEAFEDYLGRLAPNGWLAVTRWFNLPPRDGLKLFATAVAALERMGVADPGRRLALIRSWNTVTLAVKNGDLTAEDRNNLREFSHRRSFDLDYYPGIVPEEVNRYNVLEEPYLYDGAVALLSDRREEFIRRYKFHIRPATDDRPYYNDFFKWRTLPELLGLRGRGGLSLLELGYPVLAATLLQAAAAGVVLILLPLGLWHRFARVQTGRGRAGSYFLSLGLAFFFIEIAFIQKFILFLSHPIYAIAVVLCAFLIFAGLGSGYSEHWIERCRRWAPSPVLLGVLGIVVISLSYLLLFPFIFHWLMPLPDLYKIIVSLILIAPLAFFMGLPFPLGLRWVAEKMPEFIPWAWGINGCASVISAVLATILAIHFGFTVVVILALTLYGLAAVILR